MGSLLRKLTAVWLLIAGNGACAGWEAGAGLGDEIFSETPAAVQLSYVFEGRYEQVLSVGGVSERRRASREVSPNTAFASYVVRIPIKRFYLGLGAVVVSNTSEVISSEMAFTQTVGWRISERWLLEIRHISNAGLKGRNIGENLYTLSYRFD